MEIATSMAAYRRYLRDLAELRAGQPGDDLTSDLLAIHREDPDRSICAVQGCEDDH